MNKFCITVPYGNFIFAVAIAAKHKESDELKSRSIVVFAPDADAAIQEAEFLVVAEFPKSEWVIKSSACPMFAEPYSPKFASPGVSQAPVEVGSGND